MEIIDDAFFEALVPFIKRSLPEEKKYRDNPVYVKQILGAFAINPGDEFAAGYITGVIDAIRCLRGPEDDTLN